MVEKGRFLVVVSVLEGRNFPRRPKHKLIAEAKFDGELLSTDPIDHVESPDFTQELAWELDKKGLHQHRLQRTSIKIQVYASPTQSTMKETIGYVVLDLRSATNQQTQKYYPLLHSKYQKNKPELKLSIYIDDDKSNADQGFKAKEAPARAGIDPSQPLGRKPSKYSVEQQTDDEIEGPEKLQDTKKLRPILNNSEGFYQIGPKECNEHFVLSVTVAFATNLPQLIPTNIPLPDTGFFFYYSLLGNDVTNEIFKDLMNPNFPAERASVRVRSTVDTLRQFCTSQPGLELHLCCGDQSLGSADVSLASLIKQESTEIYMKPVTIEGAFQLNPPNRLKQQLPPVPDALKPVVGVSVMLRKEDMTLTGTPVKDPPPATITVPTEQTAASPPAKSPAQARQKAKGGKAKKPPTPPPTPPSPHDGSYTETFESGSASGAHDQPKQDAKHDPEASPVAAGLPAPKLVAEPALPPPQQQLYTANTANPSQGEGQQGSISPQAHHFTFSVDLRSVSNLDVPHHANVFLRYTYPFFGSTSPIMTNPPVEIRKGMEVAMPQSYCAFEFAITHHQLHDTFTRIPLIVEVWDREKEKAQHTLLGASQVHLDLSMRADRAKAVHQNGQTGYRQVWNGKVNILSTESSQRIGVLNVVLCLEDWGALDQENYNGEPTHSQAVSAPEVAPMHQMQQHQLQQQQLQQQQLHQLQLQQQQQQQQPTSPQRPAEPRETQEYKAALELEMWKEQQESLFEKQLREKEAQYMKVLAEEWKRRDREREVLVNKKVTEYQGLEEKLRKTLTDLEKRERQLAANEQEVLRLRSDLQREHERKMTELREASRRMKEDCEHQVQLEKNKVAQLEEYISRLKVQITEAETKSQGAEKEFATYKEQQNGKPEVRLQSEINLLTLEKVELERKLDAVTKSKIHYKQQWGRALKELARLKQKEQAAAKAQLMKQQQELEHMRLRYLAAEEKELVKTEKKELEDIKNELNQMKEQEPPHTPGMYPLLPDGEEVEDEHITRLIEERDTLLRTGVYTSEDRIISELDRQIRDAISKKGSEKLKKSLYEDMKRR